MSGVLKEWNSLVEGLIKSGVLITYSNNSFLRKIYR